MTTINEMIVDAFKYWDIVPELSDFTELKDIKRYHTGHYYDEATIEFFGSEDIHVAAPGVTVEYQSNAPRGYPPYVITVWVWDSGNLSPQTIEKCHLLRAADELAIEISDQWPTKVDA